MHIKQTYKTSYIDEPLIWIKLMFNELLRNFD